ncbi:phosphonate metabolism protein/1,5-bisphosphokinase (PRPP-forming) PhnN [Oleidesulfovibrio alaskensis]
MTGPLFYVMGPSGAGKDTVLDAVRSRAECAGVLFARRYITRPASAGGERHMPLHPQEFDAMRHAGQFALHWQSHGLHYGIGIEIDGWLAQGHAVVVNGSRGYLEAALLRYPAMHPVLVTAPESLIAERLAQRGRETEAQIRRRLQHNCLLADCGTGKDCAVIVNDSTVQAAAERFFSLLRPYLR